MFACFGVYGGFVVLSFSRVGTGFPQVVNAKKEKGRGIRFLRLLTIYASSMPAKTITNNLLFNLIPPLVIEKNTPNLSIDYYHLQIFVLGKD